MRRPNKLRDPWKPSVTVAAVIERGGRFLLVEEETAEGIRLNQPAGHLDPGAASATMLLDALVGLFVGKFAENAPAQPHEH